MSLLIALHCMGVYIRGYCFKTAEVSNSNTVLPSETHWNKCTLQPVVP